MNLSLRHGHGTVFAMKKPGEKAGWKIQARGIRGSLESWNNGVQERNRETSRNFCRSGKLGLGGAAAGKCRWEIHKLGLIFVAGMKIFLADLKIFVAGMKIFVAVVIIFVAISQNSLCIIHPPPQVLKNVGPRPHPHPPQYDHELWEEKKKDHMNYDYDYEYDHMNYDCRSQGGNLRPSHTNHCLPPII